jgi:hypothetical protein
MTTQRILIHVAVPISFSISIPFLIIAFSMPKMEDSVKKTSRKAKAVTVGPYPDADEHGFHKFTAILFWFLAGLYRWLKYHLWSMEIFWLLERLDDLYDLAASVFWTLLLLLRGKRRRRRYYREWEYYRRWKRVKRREARGKFLGIPEFVMPH